MHFTVCFLALFFFQAAGKPSLADVLGKSHTQVIAMRGNDYKRFFDHGNPVIQYKKNITNHQKFGNYTSSELLYFENDTCIKDIMILPANQKGSYVDSFNRQFKPAGFDSWMGPDGSFITLSLRDGLLDITSFSASYYKKLSEH